MLDLLRAGMLIFKLTQLMLIIHGFCICELFTFTHQHKINTGAFTLIHRHAQNGENSKSPNALVSQPKSNYEALCVLALFSHCKQVFFVWSIQCHICLFVVLLCLLLVILLFKMAPSTVWSGVSVCKRAVTCLLEKISVLDKLPSGPS